MPAWLALLTLHPASDVRNAFRTTAWILGPLGVLFTGAGLPLAQQFHEAFWVAVAIGAVLLVLTVSFAALARRPDPGAPGDEWRRPTP